MSLRWIQEASKQASSKNLVRDMAHQEFGISINKLTTCRGARSCMHLPTSAAKFIRCADGQFIWSASWAGHHP